MIFVLIYNSLVFFLRVDAYTTNHNRFDSTRVDKIVCSVILSSFRDCLLNGEWMTDSLSTARRLFMTVERPLFWKSQWRQRVYIILIVVCRQIVQIVYANCWFEGPWRPVQWRCLADGVVFLHYLSQSNETKRCRAATRVAVAKLLMIVMIFGVNCIALSSTKGHTLHQNDVLASEAMKKVHAGPEVTEKRHPSKNEDQTRKKIFWTKFCLYLSSEAYSVAQRIVLVQRSYLSRQIFCRKISFQERDQQ